MPPVSQRRFPAGEAGADRDGEAERGHHGQQHDPGAAAARSLDQDSWGGKRRRVHCRESRAGRAHAWSAVSAATPARIAITPASWSRVSRSWKRKYAATTATAANCEASTAATAIP